MARKTYSKETYNWKSCPFCGRSDKLYIRESAGCIFWVCCGTDNCETQGPGSSSTVGWAVRKWNKRK